MSASEDDLTTGKSKADNARVDAPTAVTSGGDAPVPPKRSRSSSARPKTVAASVAVDTVAEPVTVVDEERPTPRPRKAAKRPPATRTATRGPPARARTPPGPTDSSARRSRRSTSGR